MFCPPGNSKYKYRNGNSAQARYHPTLRAYLYSDYQETELITGAIASAVLFEEDLAKLADSTTWSLSRDATTGAYTIDTA